MTKVPERPLSRGEVFNNSKLRKIKRTNKKNHHMQKLSTERKAKTNKAAQAAGRSEWGYGNMLNRLKNLD